MAIDIHMELFPCDLEILMIDKEMDWEPYKPPQFVGKNVMGDGAGGGGGGGGGGGDPRVYAYIFFPNQSIFSRPLYLVNFQNILKS